MNKLKSIKRIMASEFVTKFTIINILILIGINLFSGITGYLNKSPIAKIIMSQMLGAAGTYLIIISLSITYRDKSSLDKNRSAYLNYSKYEVAFAKLLADICLFIVGLVLAMIITTITIEVKIPHSLSKNEIIKMISWFFGLIFFFSLVMIGFKFILATRINRILNFVFIGLWIFFTVGVFLTMGIVGSVQKDVREFIKNNKWLCASIPILNFMTPSLVIAHVMDAYYIWPLILETIFLIAILWVPTAKKLKFYFCV